MANQASQQGRFFVMHSFIMIYAILCLTVRHSGRIIRLLTNRKGLKPDETRTLKSTYWTGLSGAVVNWTQTRVKLSKLLAEGYELDATIVKGQVVFVLGDSPKMRYAAIENYADDGLKMNLADVGLYYFYLVNHLVDDTYTPDTNDLKVLQDTWDYGVIGATYLPDLVEAVWQATNYERT